jgi:hypothetical protein
VLQFTRTAYEKNMENIFERLSCSKRSVALMILNKGPTVLFFVHRLGDYTYEKMKASAYYALVTLHWLLLASSILSKIATVTHVCIGNSNSNNNYYCHFSATLMTFNITTPVESMPRFAGISERRWTKKLTRTSS